jgi:hypothetical protein
MYIMRCLFSDVFIDFLDGSHCFLMVFQCFWSPEASEESLWRPKKAPKRHPQSSKTSKKTIHNLHPKNIRFWSHVGAIFDYNWCFIVWNLTLRLGVDTNEIQVFPNLFHKFIEIPFILS